MIFLVMVLARSCLVLPLCLQYRSARMHPRSQILQSCDYSHDQLCKTLIGRKLTQHFVAIFIDKELKDRPVLRDLNMDKITIHYCVESFYFILLNILCSVGGIACGRDGDPLFTLVQAVEMLSRTDSPMA
jgi:hypothetical protein